MFTLQNKQKRVFNGVRFMGLVTVETEERKAFFIARWFQEIEGSKEQKPAKKTWTEKTETKVSDKNKGADKVDAPKTWERTPGEQEKFEEYCALHLEVFEKPANENIKLENLVAKVDKELAKEA